MKMELWYDPVNPETMLKVEERWLERDDIYGFLYPVQYLPLQNWLYPSGSWPGLAAHLGDLTRGEEISLIFFGRRVDYEDLAECLSGMPELSLYYESWDAFQKCTARLCEIPEVMKKIELEKSPFGQPVTGRPGEKQSTEENWFQVIEDERTFRTACRSGGTCCVVGEEYLSSFEKLDTLKQLTTSLKRPADSIVCRFSDQENRKRYEDYAGMFPDYKYTFLLEGEDKFMEVLKEKYGNAFLLRNRLRYYRRLYEQIKSYFDQKTDLERQMKEIEVFHGKDPDRYIGDEQWEDCRGKLEWIERKRMYMDDFHRLVFNRMTEDVELKYKEMGL